VSASTDCQNLFRLKWHDVSDQLPSSGFREQSPQSQISRLQKTRNGFPDYKFCQEISAMRILVCWDDKKQLELLKMYLNIDDHAVMATTDATQLQALMDSPQAFDVVLMSASLPDFDTSFAAFERILGCRPNCPVVVACPQSEVYRLARFLTAGLRTYLVRDDNGDFLFLVLAILEAAVKQAATEQERLVSEQLRKEVESVRELQESIIPNEIETPDGFSMVGRYESSQIRVIGSQPVTLAGGDYYESFTLPDNRVVLLIGDASGHGMKACMSIFTMHTLIRMIRFDDYLDASRLVAHVNQQLSRQSIVGDGGGFITMLYGVFDPSSREFSWASAGHQMPVLHNLETNEVVEVADAESASGLPIGIFEDAEYETNTTVVPRRSRLLLYTDGLIEAFPANTHGEHVEFGMKGLENTMRTVRESSVEVCLERLFADSFAFTQGAGRHDDTSVLILESD
jgi:phosphoserine phosphatase RsbU/P